MTARTSQEMLKAMKLIKDQGLSPSKAAIQVGLHPSTVLRSKLYKDWLEQQKSVTPFA